jgi:hypothetical protein
MLVSYKRKANIAGVVFVAFLVGDVVLLSTGHKDLWNNPVFGPVVGISWAVLKRSRESVLSCSRK